MGMMECRATPTPMDQNQKVTTQCGKLIDKERYQKVVEILLYLCHTRPDIACAVGVVSRYMHYPRSGCMDVVHRILRYLIGIPQKGYSFKQMNI
jgi:hypothetical protein